MYQKQQELLMLFLESEARNLLFVAASRPRCVEALLATGSGEALPRSGRIFKARQGVTN